MFLVESRDCAWLPEWICNQDFGHKLRGISMGSFFFAVMSEKGYIHCYIGLFLRPLLSECFVLNFLTEECFVLDFPIEIVFCPKFPDRRVFCPKLLDQRVFCPKFPDL